VFYIILRAGGSSKTIYGAIEGRHERSGVVWWDVVLEKQKKIAVAKPLRCV